MKHCRGSLDIKLAAVASLVLVSVVVWFMLREEVVVFPDLTGPIQASDLSPQPSSLGMDAFIEGGTNTLALLVKDQASSWMGLASGLKSIGIPFTIVNDTESALAHQVVMIYPTLTGSNSTPNDLRALANHVRNGGTLLAFSVIGGGMPDLFGFEFSEERPLLRELRFNSDAFTRAFASVPEEQSIRLGTASDDTDGLSGISYHNTKHLPVATFADGSAAITHNFFESGQRIGHSYAIGIDLGHFILRANNGRFNELGDTYVNTYQPKVDSLLRFITSVYKQGEPDAVLFSPTPHGKDLTVLMTHDIDFTRSLANTVKYAEFEYNNGVPATYFIQTKYVTDYNDKYFFKPESAAILQQLAGLGMEIASHSVAHSNEFRNMPVGNGQEKYPDYQPFVKDFDMVHDATMTGELRVSKFLLETLSGTTVESFRPGHLSQPEPLPQLLAATGYRFSSSITANQALTHLPFRSMQDRSYDKATDIFEFPITVEDEAGVLGNRLQDTIDTANSIARYRGLMNLLVHTDILDHKLAFVEGFITTFRDRAWFATLGQFGHWWAARDSLVLAITQTDSARRTLALSSDREISGLTLELPEGWILLDGPTGSEQNKQLLVVGTFSGTVLLDLIVN